MATEEQLIYRWDGSSYRVVGWDQMARSSTALAETGGYMGRSPVATAGGELMGKKIVSWQEAREQNIYNEEDLRNLIHSLCKKMDNEYNSEKFVPIVACADYDLCDYPDIGVIMIKVKLAKQGERIGVIYQNTFLPANPDDMVLKEKKARRMIRPEQKEDKIIITPLFSEKDK